MLLLDTGLRIEEALSLQHEDMDLDNCLIRVHGKGQKQRQVPFSMELRRILWKYIHAVAQHPQAFLFSTRVGGKLSQRNMLRYFKLLGQKLHIDGVRFSFHTLRHTMAVNYIRNGGDVFRLQRILGHATLEMTRRYVNLQTADLREVHNKLSLLAKIEGPRR
jgi:integrase/recombinase XerD